MLFRVGKFSDFVGTCGLHPYFCLENCSSNYLGNIFKIVWLTPVTFRHGNLWLLIVFRCQVLLIETTVVYDSAEILYEEINVLYGVTSNLVLRCAGVYIQGC